MKFIGLTGIIIAHVGSPSAIMMLRSFDVPLMVIISALLSKRSFDRLVSNHGTIKDYYLSRLKRLVIPTWIFLILFFLLEFLYQSVAAVPYHSIKYYIASFCLTRYGIGYVWVILIYIYSAMLTPLFNRIQLSRKGVVLISFVYALYEIAHYFKVGIDNKLIDTTFYYIIPYGVLSYLGYNYANMKDKTKRTVALVSGIVFLTLGIYYWKVYSSPQLVQIAKYPPRLYYLGYGVACSFGLMLFCERHDLKIYDNSAIRFVSMHSMWIYLWHVFVIAGYKALRLPEIWYIKLVVVYLLAVLIVVLMNKAIDRINKKHEISFLSYFRG